jgi:hypothetical protein
VDWVPWTFGHEYLCLGVSWRTGAPGLDVVEIATGAAMQIPLMGRRLGLRSATPGRYCTGRYAFVNDTATEHVPCPEQRLAESGGQCPRCASRDEFRLVHHMHRAGQVSPALVRYMAQPHWVYIATFADAAGKVGTAADLRKKSRIDEQGAVMATYVARTSGGRDARNVEDAMTDVLAVAQTRRRSAKVAALASPSPREVVLADHVRMVDRAAELVEGISIGNAGVTAQREAWVVPAETQRFVMAPRSEGRVPYPHDLLAGEHGFYVEACAGQAILARTKSSEDEVRYVVDIGALKGSRVIAGSFVSPQSIVQSALF